MRVFEGVMMSKIFGLDREEMKVKEDKGTPHQI